MTEDEIQNMPMVRSLPTQEEFAAWIASRKEAGAKIDVNTAELKGWWTPEGAPYEVCRWAPEGAHQNGHKPEVRPHFFVRDPQSRGWIWQGDLPDDKRSKMQVRIDEHNRKIKEFYANIEEAGRQIDLETCEGCWETIDESDPYGVELAPYGVINCVLFVRNKGCQDDWIWVSDLPEEKIQALRERGEREKLDEQVVPF